MQGARLDLFVVTSYCKQNSNDWQSRPHEKTAIFRERLTGRPKAVQG